MCSIKMPKGHYGTIIVRLKNVSTEQTLAKDYVCLGIRENDVTTDVLYSGKSYKYIDMDDKSKVELIPLISATKLPEYTEAEVNTKVAFSDTNFDFGTVYRITIDDKQEIEWSGALSQTAGKRLADIKSDYWYNESSGVGVGPVKNKGIRMLAINNNTGKLASSNDGISWEDEDDVLLDGESVGNWDVGTLVDSKEIWITGPVYGNGIWCVISAGGIVRYSTDEAQTWLNASQHPENITYCLAFGNGMFMTISGSSRKVYASVDANTWEPIGEIPDEKKEEEAKCLRILSYDKNNNRWMCASHYGYVYISKDGRGTWNKLVSDNEENSLYSVGTRWFSSCYAHGYFYALSGFSRGIARTADGKNWNSIGTLPQDFGNSLYFYNEMIYSIRPNGTSYLTGTFK